MQMLNLNVKPHLVRFGIVLLLVCGGCSSDENSTGNNAYELPALPSSPTPMLDLPTGRLIHPEVFIEDGRYILLANELVFGAQKSPVLRYESDDGVNFTGPTRLAGSDYWWSPSIVHHNGTWFLFYLSSQWDSQLDHDTIGLATSADGLQWEDQGTVFDGPNEAMPDTHSIYMPRVWHDGTRFHLYYTVLTDFVFDGDIGGSKSSIAHATSDDGLAFTHVDIPFAASECPGSTGGDFEGFSVSGIVRSICEEELCAEQLALTVLHEACDSGAEESARQLEVFTSSDGFAFVSPGVSIPAAGISIAALADHDTLWVFSDEETADNDGQVLVTSSALSAPLCETP